MKRISQYLNKNLILLLFIVFLASFLRLYALDKIPASLNPDEVSLGYTSFSLLKTGADEHGRFLPLALESFGDWKLPVYSYIGMIPIALFGLNDFSTRLTSALAGILAVVLFYFISKRLFKKEKLALISSLFFAISPWSIYFSRAAYEVNLATTFFLAGFLLFLEFLEKEKNRNKWLFLSIIFFSITLFTYNSFIIFSPIFVLGLLIIYKEKINPNRSFLFSIFLLVFFLSISIFYSIFVSTNKTSTLLVFNDKNTIYQRVEALRADNYIGQLKPLEQIIYNRFTGGLYQFGQNYLVAFSPTFLFDKGGEKLVDNLGYFGNLYLIDALFIFLGLSGMFLQKEKSLKLILLWLILSPIPSALTKNPQSSTRLFLLMPVLVILSSYGFYQTFVYLKKRNLLNYILKILVVIILTYNVLLFMDGYFVHLNAQRVIFWKYGYKQAVELSQKYPRYNIVMRGPENFVYIYFLFYNQYDPNKFRSQVKYYSRNSEGYLYVKSFGRFSFPESIDYNNLKSKTIYIDDNYFRFKDKILLPSGEPILSYYVTN
jgi:4-amino-4-deoxy-L-arabinose transferase-like glycosyltransferase